VEDLTAFEEEPRLTESECLGRKRRVRALASAGFAQRFFRKKIRDFSEKNDVHPNAFSFEPQLCEIGLLIKYFVNKPLVDKSWALRWAIRGFLWIW
jgi:hypothetical protein